MKPNIGKHKVLIRDAGIEDAIHLATISVQAWKESYQGIIDQQVLDTLSLEERLLSFQKFLSEKPEGHFLAYLNDTAVGFCGAGPSRYDLAKGEIYAIYVLNAYQGLSIGYQLFCAARSYLHSQNLCPFLTMALTLNNHARSFYERQGGQICGENTYEIAGQSYPELCYRFFGPK